MLSMHIYLQLWLSMARARKSLLSKRGNASLWVGQNGGTVRLDGMHCEAMCFWAGNHHWSEQNVMLTSWATQGRAEWVAFGFSLARHLRMMHRKGKLAVGGVLWAAAFDGVLHRLLDTSQKVGATASSFSLTCKWPIWPFANVSDFFLAKIPSDTGAGRAAGAIGC
eukprot:scaffold74235_cov28-Prasinocladus_malaysianus.AAC.1